MTPLGPGQHPGDGPLLCAITFDSYIKEFRDAAQLWDKTEKVGRVMA